MFLLHPFFHFYLGVFSMFIDNKLSNHRSEISYRTGSSDIAGDLRIVTEGMWSHDGETYYEPNYSCVAVALNHFSKGSNKSLQRAYNKANRQYGKQLISQELQAEEWDDADEQQEAEDQLYWQQYEDEWEDDRQAAWNDKQQELACDREHAAKEREIYAAHLEDVHGCYVPAHESYYDDFCNSYVYVLDGQLC
jgi:hypothetical protein